MPDRTRGWCPGVLDPMETGDGWLLRIRLPGGTVPSSAMRLVADVASRFGSGAIDLTSRANLQLRGVAVEVLDAAASALIDGGLALADARSDALRAIVSSPLTGHDRAGLVDASPVVAAIERRLVDGVLGSVPSKFGMVVDDGGSWPLNGVDADVRFTAHRDRAVAWWVTLRGDAAPTGLVADPASAALTAAQLCAEHRTRMDTVVADLGREIVARALGTARRSAPQLDRQALSGSSVGLHPHPDPAKCNLVAAPFLGRVDAATMIALAPIADGCAADVRLTPERSIAFCGLLRSEVPDLLAALNVLGLCVDADDPLTMLSACVGSRGCRSAYADTWAEAARLAGSPPLAERLHLSACPKACGAPVGVRHLIAAETGVFQDVVPAR